MSQIFDKITLASGEILQKGQWIQLADKIAQMFPEMKGNILPLKNYSFCKSDEFDFRYVWFHSEGEIEGAVSKVLSLAEDKVRYFLKEGDLIFCYTSCFKIEIEQAITAKEIIKVEETKVVNDASSKGGLDVKGLIGEIKECFDNYAFGLLIEYESYLIDILERFFKRRNKWQLKENPPGLIGGTAADIDPPL
mgnify:CR=1 FL=1